MSAVDFLAERTEGFLEAEAALTLARAVELAEIPVGLPPPAWELLTKDKTETGLRLDLAFRAPDEPERSVYHGQLVLGVGGGDELTVPVVLTPRE